MGLFTETSHGSLLKYEQELCGDKVEITRNNKETIAILADGLGSGVKANILATLTSSIIRTMLIGGATIEEVVETLASTLPVCKERRVAYCTFTIIRIDETGWAQFVEYENPDIIVIRDGKELIFEKKEILLHGKKVKESKVQLMYGDLCMVMSDGITSAGPNSLVLSSWKRENIVTYLERLSPKNDSVFLLKKTILTECYERYLGKIGDDSTLFLCKMQRMKKVNVMIGPPLEKKDDKRVVEAFMESFGQHVICGGKTAQIVSRIIEEPLRILRTEKSTELPPMSYMDNIDLITEGIVTVNRTVAIIKSLDSLTQKECETMQFSDEGAERLVWTLMNCGNTIVFFLGNAQNPAHIHQKNIDFGAKIKAVEELALLLKEQGKEVEIFRG